MPWGEPFGQRFVNPMTFEEWMEVHDEELSIADSENGCDYELDFNQEALRERQYEEYAKNYYKGNK